MFADHYKKVCKIFNVHEKSITEMIEANKKMINKKLEKLPAEIRTNSDNHDENEGVGRMFDSQPKFNWQ